MFSIFEIQMTELTIIVHFNLDYNKDNGCLRLVEKLCKLKI